jgi:DNA-binding transcriptional regulator YhcF (GntR family)
MIDQKEMNQLLVINNKSSLPKYRQLSLSVIDGIEKGKLKKGEQLPSINEFAAANKIAKETVAKAYADLRERGIITAHHGKGFYVAKTTVKTELNIFVLFDTFNAYKEVLYTAFRSALPKGTQCSIFFHHYNLQQFEQLIHDNLGHYNFYVIMPHFDVDVSSIIHAIPRDKLLLLDKDVPKLKNGYAAVFQDFENDIQQALATAEPKIQQYKGLQLIAGYNHFQYIPAGIIDGFKRYCKQNRITHSIADVYQQKAIKPGHAYLVFNDADLVPFIKYCEKNKWKPGEDIGLVSYDDTPLKEILLGGISVISTDFAKMGTTAGELISSRRTDKIANTARFVERKTL